MKKRILCSLLAMICTCICLAQTTKTHTVQRGENIENIAQKYAITVESLKQANPTLEKYFYVGMILKIPDIKVEEKNKLAIVEEKKSIGNEMPDDKNHINENIHSQEYEDNGSKDGLMESAYEVNFIFRPKAKAYGLRTAFLYSEYIYFPLDMAYTKNSTTVTLGVGPGVKYCTGPVMLQASITPYIGFTVVYAGAEGKSKMDADYGMDFTIGAGFKVSENLYITGGYYFGAGEYEFNKNMFTAGLGMVGIVSRF